MTTGTLEEIGTIRGKIGILRSVFAEEWLCICAIGLGVSGKDVELLTLKRTPEAILKLYPELAAVKPEWFEVYAILRSSGVSLATVPVTGAPTPAINSGNGTSLAK